MASQQQIAQNIVSQLRLLDPAIAANSGSTELLIIEAVSAAIADAQVNINSLSGALDINSKTGDNLDRFLTLFGFARQTAAQATGFVTFSTNNPPSSDIVIPANTQVFATLTSPANTTGSSTSIVYFITQFQGTIPANSFPAEITVPVIAQIAGSSGNVSANTITSFGTAPVFGITSVTNQTGTSGGIDAETDAEFQTRFQNTVFRNLAGTSDQYLALVAASKFSTQAQVIGPISRYQEYMQIPPVDDSQVYTIDKTAIGGGGVAGEYTTALSTVPNSKHIYNTVPAFVTNGQGGANTLFYQQGVDWILNTTPSAKNKGDAYRFWSAGQADPTAFPGILNPLSAKEPAVYQPNITFKNVQVVSGTLNPILSPQPEQVILFEHAYLSNASRNNVGAGVTNAVDIYVDAMNPVTATTNLAVPQTPLVFNSTPGSYLGIVDTQGNPTYQRYGQPGVSPVATTISGAGHWFFPLYSEPATALPSQITVGGIIADGSSNTTSFDQNTHYWLVQDITNLYGTVRCRNGIEWNPTASGTLLSGNTAQPLNGFKVGTTITVPGYVYDKNIVDLQATIESAKQINTDVLVHQALPRYFKLDITVVYAPGATPSSVNSSILSTVQGYFARLTFGTLIQTGSIIQAIFNVPGVQNVRWSIDLPFDNQNGHRLVECDVNGNPLTPTAANPAVFDVDFWIGDDQLAYLPTGQVVFNDNSVIPISTAQFVTNSTPPETVILQNYVDTLPGLVIRARAESTWVRGPFNPSLPTQLPVLPPD